jgi:hypothetical protein
MDKTFLVNQLVEQLRESAAVARKAGQAAEDEARHGATPAEKRENARVAMEFAGLARGQRERAGRAAAELSTLETFRPPRLPAGGPIAVGAIVEVEDGSQGRTFFLAPVKPPTRRRCRLTGCRRRQNRTPPPPQRRGPREIDTRSTPRRGPRWPRIATSGAPKLNSPTAAAAGTCSSSAAARRGHDPSASSLSAGAPRRLATPTRSSTRSAR